MTKKDFVVVADIVADAILYMGKSEAKHFVHIAADMLAQTNPRFKRDRFERFVYDRNDFTKKEV